MISPAYVHTMAPYNSEMNRRIYAGAATLSDEQRRADRVEEIRFGNGEALRRRRLDAASDIRQREGVVGPRGRANREPDLCHAGECGRRGDPRCDGELFCAVERPPPSPFSARFVVLVGERFQP